MKVGARGISLLFASGDEGANCKAGKYKPETPASSPFVTTVGGTAPASGFPNPGSEKAVGLSSGGFSDYWGMPDYQKDAVAGYLAQSGLPSPSLGYNTSGRAYPDIAAQATNFCVTPFGCGVSETSCASPTAGGIIGLQRCPGAEWQVIPWVFEPSPVQPLFRSFPGHHYGSQFRLQFPAGVACKGGMGRSDWFGNPQLCKAFQGSVGSSLKTTRKLRSITVMASFFSDGFRA